MFYVKDNHDNFIGFTGEVYAQCPECGKLFPVDDIVEWIHDVPDFDLYSTCIWCDECSEARREVFD